MEIFYSLYILYSDALKTLDFCTAALLLDPTKHLYLLFVCPAPLKNSKFCINLVFEHKLNFTGLTCCLLVKLYIFSDRVFNSINSLHIYHKVNLPTSTAFSCPSSYCALKDSRTSCTGLKQRCYVGVKKAE